MLLRFVVTNGGVFSSEISIYRIPRNLSYSTPLKFQSKLTQATHSLNETNVIIKKILAWNIPINSNASGNISDKFALQLSSTGSFLYLKPGRCSKELGLSCVTFKIYEIPYFFKMSKSEESFSLPRYKCGRICTGTLVRLS